MGNMRSKICICAHESNSDSQCNSVAPKNERPCTLVIEGSTQERKNTCISTLTAGGTSYLFYVKDEESIQNAEKTLHLLREVFP